MLKVARIAGVGVRILVTALLLDPRALLDFGASTVTVRVRLAIPKTVVAFGLSDLLGVCEYQQSQGFRGSG